jgi:hypothetical protein
MVSQWTGRRWRHNPLRGLLRVVEDTNGREPAVSLRACSRMQGLHRKHYLLATILAFVFSAMGYM